MNKFIVIFAIWIGWSSYQLTRGKSIAPSIFSMIDFHKSIDTNMVTKKLLFGIGYDDSTQSSNKTAHYKWYRMLERCYSERYLIKKPTYRGCTVCDEWTTFSNFEKWFSDSNNGYRYGYHLDKDILMKGNKVYSPQTCCFVPQEINSIFIKDNSRRGNLPIGVTKRNEEAFVAQVHFHGIIQYLGVYKTKELAFNAYKREKEVIIKIMGDEYYKKGLITKKVYNALLNYEVEITD